MKINNVDLYLTRTGEFSSVTIDGIDMADVQRQDYL